MLVETNTPNLRSRPVRGPSPRSTATILDMTAARTITLFVLAGLAEIGGAYLIWRWLREGSASWVGALGGAVLVAYGVIPTLSHATFGRVYAAYGGVFVVMSLLWGWGVDGARPDR